MLSYANDGFIEKSNEFIKKYPNNVNAYISLADTYENMGEYDKSLNVILSGISQNKDNVDLLDRYTTLLIDNEDIERAHHIVNEIMNLGNPTAITYGNMGIISVVEDNENRAIECYQKSLNLEPDNIFTLSNLAMLYNRMYKYELALTTFQSAQKIEDSESIREHIAILEKKVNNSKFELGNIVELPIAPKSFHLPIYDNFSAKIEDGVIKITGCDDRILIIVNHEQNNFSDEKITGFFNDFKGHLPNVYSIIRKFEIIDRADYKDKFASKIFTMLQHGSKLENFYAVAIATNEEHTLLVSISSTIQVTPKLIDFAKSIIDNIYFL